MCAHRAVPIARRRESWIGEPRSWETRRRARMSFDTCWEEDPLAQSPTRRLELLGGDAVRGRAVRCRPVTRWVPAAGHGEFHAGTELRQSVVQLQLRR